MIITFLIRNANLYVNYERTFVYLTWFFSVANIITKIKLLRSIGTTLKKTTQIMEHYWFFEMHFYHACLASDEIKSL